MQEKQRIELTYKEEEIEAVCWLIYSCPELTRKLDLRPFCKFLNDEWMIVRAMSRFIVLWQQGRSVLFEGLDVDQETIVQMLEIILPKFNAMEYIMGFKNEEQEGEFILTVSDFNSDQSQAEVPNDIIITTQVSQKLEIALACLQYSHKPIILVGPSFTGKSTFVRLLAALQR